MRAVVNLLYRISQMGYFSSQFPDFMPQGVGNVFLEFVDIHLRQIHVLLAVVGAEALDLLTMAAAVEQPAATGDEG